MSSPKAGQIKLAVAVIALVAAGVIAAMQFGGAPKGPSQQAYYFDLGSGEVFVAETSIASIDAPSGSQGVRANVISCGACTADQWQVLTIESYTPKAQEILAKPQPDTDDAAALNVWNNAESEGKRIALPPNPGEEPKWVRFADYLSLENNDATINALRRASENLCEGSAPTICKP